MRMCRGREAAGSITNDNKGDIRGKFEGDEKRKHIIPKTIKGAFPPSSRETRLTVDAHCCMRSFPTAVDPVKLSLRTSTLVANSVPTLGAFAREHGTTLITPLGIPARSGERRVMHGHGTREYS